MASLTQIVTGFLGQTPSMPAQSGTVDGKFYTRTGQCNQCGKCCNNIYLIYNKVTVTSLAQFNRLKQIEPEYQYFTPLDETEHGIRFRCRHLKSDNSCAIYADRPDFCQQYPNEQGIMLGGELAQGCGYTFTLNTPFKHVLESKTTAEPKSFVMDTRPTDPDLDAKLAQATEEL